MLLNPPYIEQYKIQHKKLTYGHTGVKFAGIIQGFINQLRPKTILDYGCGQCRMGKNLKLNGSIIDYYDPAISEISKIPSDHYDFIINTDVMEHIPESDVNDVIGHIRSLSDTAFFNISLRPAKTILPNSTNAHCTVKEEDWWVRKLLSHFKFLRSIETKTKSMVRMATDNREKHRLICQT